MWLLVRKVLKEKNTSFDIFCFNISFWLRTTSLTFTLILVLFSSHSKLTKFPKKMLVSLHFEKILFGHQRKKSQQLDHLSALKQSKRRNFLRLIWNFFNPRKYFYAVEKKTLKLILSTIGWNDKDGFDIEYFNGSNNDCFDIGHFHLNCSL